MDWSQLAPFEIIWCEFRFDGDPQPEKKYFIVVNNLPDRRLVICFKPTSQTKSYDDPIRLAGVVSYAASEIGPDFREPLTLIDPNYTYPLSYEWLRTQEANHSFRRMYAMPLGFGCAVRRVALHRKDWRKKVKDDFFRWFPPCICGNRCGELPHRP